MRLYQLQNVYSGFSRFLLTEKITVKWDDDTGGWTLTGGTNDAVLQTVATTDETTGTTTITTYIVVYNGPDHELPYTGGAGTYMFTLGGIAILAMLTLVYGCGLRRRRERRAE